MMGRMGRAAFSRISPLHKAPRQPRSQHEGREGGRPGGHGQSPEGGRTGRLVPRHSPAWPRAPPSSLLPPQRGHSHAQRCQDMPGSTRVEERWRCKAGEHHGEELPQHRGVPSTDPSLWEAFHPSVPAKVPGIEDAI